MRPAIVYRRTACTSYTHARTRQFSAYVAPASQPAATATGLWLAGGPDRPQCFAREQNRNPPPGQTSPSGECAGISRSPGIEDPRGPGPRVRNANARDVDAAAQRDARVADVTVTPPAARHRSAGELQIHRCQQKARRARPVIDGDEPAGGRRSDELASDPRRVSGSMMCVCGGRYDGARAPVRTCFVPRQHRVRSHRRRHGTRFVHVAAACCSPFFTPILARSDGEQQKKTHCHAPRQCTPQMQSFSNLLDRSIGRSPDRKACWLYVVVLTVAAIGR